MSMSRFFHPVRAGRIARVAVVACTFGFSFVGATAPTVNLRSSARAAEGDPQVALEKYRLENGLEVILHPDNTVPLAYVSVWYHVGSGDEVVGKSGFAHLFEHMMFQGSTNVGEDKHFEVLRKIGASTINGTTNTDRTNYFEQVPSNQLETALWLESDRMGHMLPLLTEKSLENQREVVRNERRQNYDNVPYGKDRFAVNRRLYAEGHPYRYLTIGRHEDLQAASLEDVKSFFRKWYVPANATLLIAGDIDVPATKKLVEKWFGSFPKAAKPARRSVPVTPVAGPVRETVNDEFAKLRRIHYAWHSPKAFGPGDAELDILASVLANPGTGRLFKTLVHEKQWAQNVASVQQSQEHSGIFHIYVDLKPDADQKAVEAVLEAELDRVMKEPISERERKRVVTQVEASFVRGLETLVGRGENAQSYNHFLGEPNSFTHHLDLFRNATVEKVREVAAATLKRSGRVEIITIPATPAAPKPGAPAAKPPTVSSTGSAKQGVN
ncbi:MAG TPA: pitrilysin family protein [Polyangia bacterium]